MESLSPFPGAVETEKDSLDAVAGVTTGLSGIGR
jgi:hypothetical protein